MARTLTVARARVPAAAEADYLAAVRELAAVQEPRGRHLWLFRRPDQPGVFLECSECRTREGHRAVADLPPDERRLEERIRALASYEPGTMELWEEVG